MNGKNICTSPRQFYSKTKNVELFNILICIDFFCNRSALRYNFLFFAINAREMGNIKKCVLSALRFASSKQMRQFLNNKNLFIRPLQRAPYFFAGVDRTFFSSISLFAALFFSALSCAFGGEFCGLRGLVTGSVAVLSPPAAASTSTVATLQSPPPTIVDFVLSHGLLTIVKRYSQRSRNRSI